MKLNEYMFGTDDETRYNVTGYAEDGSTLEETGLRLGNVLEWLNMKENGLPGEDGTDKTIVSYEIECLHP